MASWSGNHSEPRWLLPRRRPAAGRACARFVRSHASHERAGVMPAIVGSHAHNGSLNTFMYAASFLIAFRCESHQSTYTLCTHTISPRSHCSPFVAYHACSTGDDGDDDDDALLHASHAHKALNGSCLSWNGRSTEAHSAQAWITLVSVKTLRGPRPPHPPTVSEHRGLQCTSAS